MVLAEFMAMAAIHAVKATFVPQPLAWGAYDTLPDVHFLLCAFRNMRHTLPDVDVFPAMVAELHRAGGGASPNGKFGFPVPTFHGNIPIHHGWSDSWEEYFTRTTRVLLEQEQKTRGNDEEIQRLSRPFFDKVIPRLLRPMEARGRVLRPSLIHGDLWHGNAGVDVDTNLPVIFDAASFYAHNECQLPNRPPSLPLGVRLSLT